MPRPSQLLPLVAATIVGALVAPRLIAEPAVVVIAPIAPPAAEPGEPPDSFAFLAVLRTDPGVQDCLPAGTRLRGVAVMDARGTRFIPDADVTGVSEVLVACVNDAIVAADQEPWPSDSPRAKGFTLTGLADKGDGYAFSAPSKPDAHAAIVIRTPSEAFLHSRAMDFLVHPTDGIALELPADTYTTYVDGVVAKLRVRGDGEFVWDGVSGRWLTALPAADLPDGSLDRAGLIDAAETVRLIPHLDYDGVVDGMRLSGLRRDHPLARAGLKNGDVLHALDEHVLTNVDALLALEHAAPSSWLHLTRRGQRYRMPVVGD